MEEQYHPGWEYFTIQKLRGQNFASEWPTIPELLQYTVERFPDNAAFTTFESGERESISYRELAVSVEALSRSLQKLGLKPGAKAVLSGKNSPAWGISYLAILCAGAVVVPLDARQDSSFHKHLIDFCEARWVFMDADLLHNLANWEDQEHTAGHQSFLLCPYTATKQAAEGVQPEKNRQNIWDLIEEQKPHVTGKLSSLAALRSEDLAALLTTSGTTGHEKVAMLSHANFTSNVIQCVYPGLQEILASDRIYLLLPMHHCYPMTAVFLECISHGSEVVFPRGMAIQQILQDLKDAKVTVFMGIPMLFNKIIQGVFRKVKAQGALKNLMFRLLLRVSHISDKIGHPLGAKLFRGVLGAMGFDHIRILICGAGALLPEVGERYRQLGLDFIQGYGLTEAAPIVTLNPAGTPELRSVGRLLPMIQGRLDHSVELPAETVQGHEAGELCISGPNIMLGYYKNEEANKEVFTEDGFLRTGDMGYFDEKGYFYITGRCKNVIVTSGGKNIYPEEIEELFQLCSWFEQVLIRGYREAGTEKVELLVYPKLSEQDLSRIEAEPEKFLSNEQLTGILSEELRGEILSDIRQINQQLLAYQKISRVRIVVVPLAMTTTKKIKRPLVEERLDQYDDGLLIHAQDF